MSFAVVHTSCPMAQRAAGAQLALKRPSGDIGGVRVRLSILTGSNDGSAPPQVVGAPVQDLWQDSTFPIPASAITRASQIAIEARLILEEPPDATGKVTIQGTLTVNGKSTNLSVDVALEGTIHAAPGSLVWWLDP